MCVFNLGGKEEDKCLENHVPHKVRKILMEDAQYALRPFDNIRIGIVMEYLIKTGNIIYNGYR